ncbi:MAG: hypothetical protein HQK89_16105 [Nitrospirae bacterium]|nr:hypothetical protein [Nitrospirota bacterium]
MKNTKRTTGDGLSRFQRYRWARHGKGMKLLRIRVPDIHSPEFAKDLDYIKVLRLFPDIAIETTWVFNPIAEHPLPRAGSGMTWE